MTIDPTTSARCGHIGWLLAALASVAAEPPAVRSIPDPSTTACGRLLLTHAATPHVAPSHLTPGAPCLDHFTPSIGQGPADTFNFLAIPSDELASPDFKPVPWPQQGCNRLPSGKCAPAVFITGAKKCGTNSVDDLLRLHPYARFFGQPQTARDLVLGAGGFLNENQYLICGAFGPNGTVWPAKFYHCSSDREPDVAMYSHLVTSSDWKTTFSVDRTPEANVAPLAAARAHRVSPDGRVILVVCEPIHRAWSSMNHEYKMQLFDMVKWGFKQLKHRDRPRGIMSELKPEQFGAVLDAIGGPTYDNLTRWLTSARSSPEVARIRATLIERADMLTAAIDAVEAEFGAGYDGVLRCAQQARAKQYRDPPFDVLTLRPAVICRQLLLGGFYFDGLAPFEKLFKRHQLIVVNGNWLFNNEEAGAAMLYKALGVPGDANVTAARDHHHGPHKRKLRKEGADGADVHSNKGSKVNPLYLDSRHIPPKLTVQLQRIFGQSIATLRALFGNSSVHVHDGNAS